MGYFLRVTILPYFPFPFPDLDLSPLVLMAFWGHFQASGRGGRGSIFPILYIYMSGLLVFLLMFLLNRPKKFIVFLFYCIQSHTNITQ
jgi:hypothetical protein